jgi:hypothetical protein
VQKSPRSPPCRRQRRSRSTSPSTAEFRPSRPHRRSRPAASAWTIVGARGHRGPEGTRARINVIAQAGLAGVAVADRDPRSIPGQSCRSASGDAVLQAVAAASPDGRTRVNEPHGVATAAWVETSGACRRETASRRVLVSWWVRSGLVAVPPGGTVGLRHAHGRPVTSQGRPCSAMQMLSSAAGSTRPAGSGALMGQDGIGRRREPRTAAPPVRSLLPGWVRDRSCRTRTSGRPCPVAAGCGAPRRCS